MDRSERAQRLVVRADDPFRPVDTLEEAGETRFPVSIPAEVVEKYPLRWVLLRHENGRTIVVRDADDLPSLLAGGETRDGDVSAFVRDRDRAYAQRPHPGLPRLFVDYDPNLGPSLQLALSAKLPSGQWGPHHYIDAVVDSGATRSSIQSADADALGITTALRAPAGSVRYANGQTEQTFEPTVRVAVKVIDPATGSMWGPTFTFSPTIKQSGDRLLGTSDFFEIFEVAFWPDAIGSRFSLVY